MKIICIGLNYKDHILELDGKIPSVPLFFLKPDTSLVTKRHVFYYPEFSNEIHYEAELVLKICKVGRHIQKKFAHTYYDEIGAGIDFTARDLQRACMSNGNPLEISKSFEISAPVSQHFIKINDFQNLKNIKFHLNRNGILCQEGNSSDMIFGFDEIIAYVSQFITLKMGDLIFTGTPAGVGEVKIGDKLEVFIEDRKMLTVLTK